MHSKLLFLGKNHYLKKINKFYRWALYYFFIFFGLVMCMNHKHEALWVIEKMYIIYFMHIDFIQSSSFNNWIKLSLEFQNVVMHI
jgi:hypothetical protein